MCLHIIVVYGNAMQCNQVCERAPDCGQYLCKLIKGLMPVFDSATSYLSLLLTIFSRDGAGNAFFQFPPVSSFHPGFTPIPTEGTWSKTYLWTHPSLDPDKLFWFPLSIGNQDHMLHSSALPSPHELRAGASQSESPARPRNHLWPDGNPTQRLRPLLLTRRQGY